MKIKEYYKIRIKQIEDDIVVARMNKDYKSIAKLQGEKLECEERLSE